MKLPFTFEQTAEVRAAYCAAEAQKNLAKALEAVLREVETKVLFTNETVVTMNFSEICKRYNVNGAGYKREKETEEYMKVAPVYDELVAKIKAGFPTSVVTLEKKTEYVWAGEKEFLTIDWTPPLKVEE